MVANTPLEISVKELLVTFRRSLCALVPIADELKIPWREPENYADWDAVASGVFEGFVLAPLRAMRSGNKYYAFIEYDKRVTNYDQYSYLAAEIKNEILPLICLESDRNTFDYCLLAKLDVNSGFLNYIRVPLEELRLVAVFTNQDGTEMAEMLALG